MYLEYLITASAPIEALKCYFSLFRKLLHTDQPTNTQTDIRVHREVPIIDFSCPDTNRF